LLFYERIIPINEEIIEKVNELKKEESKELENLDSSQNDVKTLEIQKNSDKPEVKKPENYLDEFLQEILKDNLKFHIHRNIFSGEYFNFMVELVSKRKFEENNDYLEYPFVYDEKKHTQKHFDLEALKLGVLFLLTCIFRERERQNNASFLPFLKKQLARVYISIISFFSFFSAFTLNLNYRTYLLVYGSCIVSQIDKSSMNSS